MPLRSKSIVPKVLVIESPDPSKNIILAIENMEECNKSLKDSLRDSIDQLDWIKKLLGKI
jgi:hypothetical protein